jgi:hypothetical protein
VLARVRCPAPCRTGLRHRAPPARSRGRQTVAVHRALALTRSDQSKLCVELSRGKVKLESSTRLHPAEAIKVNVAVSLMILGFHSSEPASKQHKEDEKIFASELSEETSKACMEKTHMYAS